MRVEVDEARNHDLPIRVDLPARPTGIDHGLHGSDPALANGHIETAVLPGCRIDDMTAGDHRIERVIADIRASRKPSVTVVTHRTDTSRYDPSPCLIAGQCIGQLLQGRQVPNGWIDRHGRDHVRSSCRVIGSPSPAR